MSYLEGAAWCALVGLILVGFDACAGSRERQRFYGWSAVVALLAGCLFVLAAAASAVT